MKKIAIFADVQNLYYTTRDVFGRAPNYRKIWQKIAEDGKITEASAYAIDKGDEGQLKFQTALHKIGFKVKLKPYIQRQDGSAKGDWDVGITIDVIARAAHVDKIVLLSGDGDFDLLLEYVSEEFKIETEVYGVAKLTANSLRQAAQRFFEIDQNLLI